MKKRLILSQLTFFIFFINANAAFAESQNQLQNAPSKSHVPPHSKNHVLSKDIRFTGKANFTLLDNQKNRPLKSLEIQLEVEILKEGTYLINGPLIKGNKIIANRPTYYSVMSSSTNITQKPGLYWVSLNFSGEEIFESNIDGPYQLKAYALSQGSYHEFTFTTPTYRHEDFGELGIHLINIVNEQSIDEDKDKKLNCLKISVGVQIRQPGKYAIQGTLLSKRDETISYAYQIVDVDQIGPRTIDLFFPGGDIKASKQNGPYPGLINVYEDGSNTGSLEFKSRKYYSSDFQEAVVASKTFNEQPLDNNGNGIYDHIQISFDMLVDSYRKANIHGWLTIREKKHNISSSDVSFNLVPGKNTIVLDFEGSDIKRSKTNGPYNVGPIYWELEGRSGVSEDFYFKEVTELYQADDFE